MKIMYTEPSKKDRTERPESKDTRVKVSEIIDFGQKISGDWLEEEGKRKVQTKKETQQPREEPSGDEQDSTISSDEAPEPSATNRSTP